jgi:hypothetical protein
VRVSLHELETHWSIDDLLSAHIAIDIHEELEAKAHREAER